MRQLDADGDKGIGIITRNPSDRVALRGVRLRARLAGMSVKATIEQTFVNLEDRAIEAVYTFPLPESAAVCAFEVVTADHVLTGTVDERDSAMDRYEEAINDGDGAFMLEQDRPDVFSVRVGNLKRRQAATIRITYVQPLQFMDRRIRLVFPTTVAPRYVTDTGLNDPLGTAIDGDALNPPHVMSTPYGLTLEIDVDLARRVTAIISPSHAIRTEDLERERHRIALSSPGGVTEMNRDIVICIDLKKDLQPVVQRGTWKDGGTYLAATFIPEFDERELIQRAPAEIWFLLDCSGSMRGDSIEQATAALELCLRSMSEGDRFNICRFGSTFELMNPEPLVYSQRSLEKAIAWCARAKADLGGTELYAPLQAICSTQPRLALSARSCC